MMTIGKSVIRLICGTALFSVSLVALTSEKDTAVPAGGNIAWQAPQRVASGPAEVGPWRMNDSQFYYVDDGAASLRSDGDLAVVWVDNQRQDVFLQRFDSGNKPLWQQPVNVSRSSEVFSWLPKTKFLEDDQLYVLWQEIVFSGGSHGGEIFFARSSDGGKTFAQAINLSQTENGAGKGRLSEKRWDNGSYDFALGPDGAINVVWTEYQGALRFARSTDNGRSFSEPIRVAGSDKRPTRAPAIAVNADGKIYLAWTVGETDTADVHITRSSDGGETFQAAQTPYSSEGYSDVPDLAVDRDGELHIVFSESATRQSRQTQIFYLRLNSDGAALIKPQQISAGDKAAGAPALASDGDNKLYVVWEYYPRSNHFSRGLGFAASLDSGHTFTPPQVVSGSSGREGAINGSLQGDLGHKIAANEQGEWVVTNSLLRRGKESRVVYIRGHLKAP